ncbi:hypothetical protein GCM10009804_67580 [Kribbella hippodromi]|uniref:Uncharacterized protein n=1 Tax=Kribbella hippodromi TaxID=434347 RepID=A0ABP4Q5K5_9ACTN
MHGNDSENVAVGIGNVRGALRIAGPGLEPGGGINRGITQLPNELADGGRVVGLYWSDPYGSSDGEVEVGVGVRFVAQRVVPPF